jgi:predicted membrane channel-forming protein YqfA (hemolysin III family)
LFGVIGGLVLAGALVKCWFVVRFRILSTAAYKTLEWLVELVSALVWPPAGGAGLYPFSHAFRSVFVMAGSIYQYFAVLSTVIPPRS